jgi:UDP-N-acetylglucosamine--N-acetylmuramyl-(pentapeptide) pyrophosphoryl-undecaprenol N-acetylglucosamine transferase
MNATSRNNPFVAIACGGTGGHLFPGLAVAEQLQQRGCDVALLISPKDVDQQGVKSALERRAPPRQDSAGVPTSACPSGAPPCEFRRAGSETGVPDELQIRAGSEPGAPFEVFTLPAVGLQNRNYFSFAGSFVKSLFAARRIFRRRRPQAVLAMGGFTSAPPIFVAKELGAKTFLHESNTIPGKANRYLARFVNAAFVGFPETAARLRARAVTTTGTPVRSQFQFAFSAPADCRAALGLEAGRPTILVVGGSQGARGLNEMILSALPLLAHRDWQWLHLTGRQELEKVQAAYALRGIPAVVKPFLSEMDLALGAATACVSRAGASALAEIAALRLPSLLVPYPAAADNHQLANARAFASTGAARLLEQQHSTPQKIVGLLCELVEDAGAREAIKTSLAAQWHAPQAAEKIAESILGAISAGRDRRHYSPAPPGRTDSSKHEPRGGDGSSPRFQFCSINPSDEPSPPRFLNPPRPPGRKREPANLRVKGIAR